jgi:hypothetical protein
MLIYNGIEGEDWDIVDGKPQLNDEVVQGFMNDSEYALKTGIYKYHNIAGVGTVDYWPEYDVPADLSYMPNALKLKLTEVEKDACDYFNVDYPGQIVMEGKNNIFGSKGERTLVFKALPTEGGEVGQRNKEVTAQLTEIMTSDIYEAVLAESEAEFAELKAELIEKCIRLGAADMYDYNEARFYSGE